MKKPVISLKKPCERLKLLFGILLSASALALFFIPREAVQTFAGGEEEGVRGLINLINGWL